jgi:hypothetical protein
MMKEYALSKRGKPAVDGIRKGRVRKGRIR